MALNDVVFVKGQGGLGRPLSGEDHISGLVYYCDSIPSETAFASEPIQTVYSLEEAEALGIKGDYSNETPAVASVLITSEGSANSSIDVLIAGSSIGKASFTTAAADEAAVATALISAINAKSHVHGYKATVGATSATVKITAKAGLGDGAYPTVTTTLVGGITTTITAFADGEVDPFITLWYHVKEYFRIQPKGVLYIGVYEVDVMSEDFEEIKLVQDFTQTGKIRQIGVYTTEDFSNTQVTTIHNKAAELAALHAPLSVLLGANVDNIDSLPDLSANASLGSYVSVVIGQDGNALGKSLYDYTGKSITCLGAALGAVSRSKVSENIGWVKNYNMAEAELDVIAFADGQLYRDIADAQLSSLNDYHYIFLRKHIGVSGSYFNDSHTAIIESSDYSTIENNRTIDKAIRNIRSFVIPELSGPLFVEPTSGKLAEDTIAYFKSLTSRPLEQMQRDGELSGFGVTIDSEQNVLSDSKLVIAVQLIPVGVARQIQVNIGFTVKIS